MNLLQKLIRKTIITPLEKAVLLFYQKTNPIQKEMIVFETEGDYWDNGRVFYEYLIANEYNYKYHIVWFVHEPQKYKKEANVEFVSRFNFGINFRAMKILAQGHCFLFTHPWWFVNRRPGQVAINLTHSTMQLKAGGMDVSNSFDYILCASEAAKNVKRVTYHAKEEQMVILGMPRNDLLCNKIDLSKLIKGYKYGKVVLSMVTFKQSISNTKDSKKPDYYSLNVVVNEEQMKSLNTFLFQNQMYLLIKIHHLQDMSFLKNANLTNVIYLKDEDLSAQNIQLYELLGTSDALMTDYSSVFYDYLFVNRPIGFLIDDLKTYERGFCVEDPLAAMPGEKIFSFDQLLEFLRKVNLGKDDYSEIRNKMLYEVHYYKTGHCKRLIDWLEANVLKE